jgi:hypothetical protein
MYDGYLMNRLAHIFMILIWIGWPFVIISSLAIMPLGILTLVAYYYIHQTVRHTRTMV